MKDSIKDYIRKFLSYSKNGLIKLLLFTFLSSLLEGISLFLLIPFLYTAGSMTTNSTFKIPAFLDISHIFPEKSHALLFILLIYLIVTICQEFIKRNNMIASTIIKAGFNRKLSADFYKAFSEAKWQAILTKKRSDIANALTNELRTIDIGTQVLLQIVTIIPTALIQIVISFIISPYVTLAAFISGAVFFLLMKPVNRKLGNLADSINNILKDSLSDINEHLNGIKEVKSYAAEHEHLERFSRKIEETENKYVQFISLFSTSNFIYNSGTFFILISFIFTAVAVFKVDIAKLIVLFIIFFRVWPLFLNLQTSSQFFIIMFPAWESFSKRMEELKSLREKNLKTGETQTLPLNESIELNNISFHYEANDKFALKQINLKIPANSVTAITGISGSGKSTLVDVIIGLLEPQDGEILIDGKKLEPEMIQSWRRSIGYVPQETFLFNGTVRENLLWAKQDADDEDIKSTLSLSASEEFINDLSLGLETYVGDKGTRFSGGQRQRIALARAMLRKPSLLILDEATSALDSENEKRIQNAIKSLHGKTTIIIVAHRLSTIKDADEIILLENGSIVEKGRFEELIEKVNGRFTELARDFNLK